MRKHNLSINIGLLTVTLMILLIGLLIGRMAVSTATVASAQMPQHYLAATQENLGYLGLEFTRVDSVDFQIRGIINRDQAIAAALSNCKRITSDFWAVI